MVDFSLCIVAIDFGKKRTCEAGKVFALYHWLRTFPGIYQSPILSIMIIVDEWKNYFKTSVSELYGLRMIRV